MSHYCFDLKSVTNGVDSSWNKLLSWNLEQNLSLFLLIFTSFQQIGQYTF